jgi:type IV pilus assembly protein PilE
MRDLRHETSPLGFSLLELVVVVAVMGILLAIAVPTYREYAQRAHRADAIRAMLAVAGCQEKIRMNNGFYDTSRCVDHNAIDNYRLRLEPAANPAASGFTVFAVPLENRGNTCGTLTLDHTGSRGIGEESGSLTSCWSGR